jgi:Na+-translocating ferredoxin:NAD+ oxidoreductase RnfA subunit
VEYLVSLNSLRAIRKSHQLVTGQKNGRVITFKAMCASITSSTDIKSYAAVTQASSLVLVVSHGKVWLTGNWEICHIRYRRYLVITCTVLWVHEVIMNTKKQKFVYYIYHATVCIILQQCMIESSLIPFKCCYNKEIIQSKMAKHKESVFGKCRGCWVVLHHSYDCWSLCTRLWDRGVVSLK